MTKAVAAEIVNALRLREPRMSGRELARRIGMATNTMAVKLRGESQFGIGELEDIARVLEVDLLVLIGRARATLPHPEG